MGPNILLDKSTLQALSKKELILLNKLYQVIIPPILPTEILADLKKNTVGNTLNEAEVIQIANKLIQKDNVVNVDYHQILISSLMGNDSSKSRRPIPCGGKKVVDKDGKVGIRFNETQEIRAIRQWQQGNFSEAEKILAEQWRRYTTDIDLESYKKMFAAAKILYPICNDFPDLIRISEKLINQPEIQVEYLKNIIEELQIDQNLASQIFYRWESEGFNLIKDFAPYFYYVTKVETAFRLGLVYGLVTPRSTNLIDEQYLHYLPFCNAFSSRDNFHKTFGKIFLESDQTFIDGDDLKIDLKEIVDQLENEDKELNLDWSTSFSVEPPNNPDSLTYKMWKKYWPDWSPGWFYRKSEAKEYTAIPTELKERIDSLQEIKTQPWEPVNEDEIEFMSVEYEISLEDQCPCGSGQKFKDCHYEEGMETSHK